jgi:hypothetical protein
MDLNICTLVILSSIFFVIILHIHKGYFHGHNTSSSLLETSVGSTGFFPFVI